MDLVEPEALLETDRLWLEPLHPFHALALYEPLQARDIYTFIPGDPPTSPEALAARYQQLVSRQSPDGQQAWLNWVMRERKESWYVGTLEATVFPDAKAYIAYILFPDFWKQGYAREGCKRMLSLLFRGYRVRSVEAEIDTRNAASINLIESLGFQRVSTTLDADFFKGVTSHEYRYLLHSPLEGSLTGA